MRKIVIIILLLISVQSFAQKLKLNLVPQIGTGDIFCKYEEPLYFTNEYRMKQYFVDITPYFIKKHAGLYIEIIKNNKTLITGISSGLAGFGYKVKLYENYYISDTLANGYVIEAESLYHYDKIWRYTWKIPLYINIPIFKENHCFSKSILQNYNFNFTFQFGINLIYMKPSERTLDINKIYYTKNDTISINSMYYDANNFSLSFNLGFNFHFYRKDKEIFRLITYYDQGTLTLYSEHFTILKQNIPEYTNLIYIRGSYVYFGIGIPIRVLK